VREINAEVVGMLFFIGVASVVGVLLLTIVGGILARAAGLLGGEILMKSLRPELSAMAVGLLIVVPTFYILPWLDLILIRIITLACYPAAISPEPGNTTGRRRGGIAGR